MTQAIQAKRAPICHHCPDQPDLHRPFRSADSSSTTLRHRLPCLSVAKELPSLSAAKEAALAMAARVPVVRVMARRVEEFASTAAILVIELLSVEIAWLAKGAALVRVSETFATAVKTQTIQT